jgi:hypothetical protein
LTKADKRAAKRKRRSGILICSFLRGAYALKGNITAADCTLWLSCIETSGGERKVRRETRFSPTLKYRSSTMSIIRQTWLGVMGLLAAATVTSTPASAQQPSQKPNILFIMGDDIGIMQPSIYHQGFAVGETPNIDRIGLEGAKFTDYYAEQSCTAGRNAFFTGMHPLLPA